MKLKCPRCSSTLESGNTPAGANLTCSCGNVVSVPKRSSSTTWVIVLVASAFACIPVIGILAAIAIPNFIRFQARAKQAECKVNLKSAYTAQRSLFAQQEAYAADLSTLGWEPERGNRYAYLLAAQGELVDRATAPAAQAAGVLPDSAKEGVKPLTAGQVRAAAAVAAPGVDGECPDCGTTIVCVGNIDSDEALDVWSVATFERSTEDGQVIVAGEPFQHVDDIIE